MVNVAELLLEDDEGVKLTEIVQEEPAVRLLPQLLAKMPKLLALAPPMVTLAMLRVPVPVLDRVTVCGVVLVPKPMDVGLTEAMGSAMPVPLSAADCWLPD